MIGTMAATGAGSHPVAVVLTTQRVEASMAGTTTQMRQAVVAGWVVPPAAVAAKAAPRARLA